jgi:flagellar biosynthesis protein FlhF
LKIKKYQGKTETEAMLKVKDELGKEALILNIKTIKPKGFYRLFRKPTIEVTAAVDESSKEENIKSYVKRNNGMTEAINQNAKQESVEEIEVKVLEKKIDSLQSLIEKQMSIEKVALKEEDKDQDHEKQSVLELIYNQLIHNEVDEILANDLIQDIALESKEEDVDDILTKVYQKVVKLLDKPSKIICNEGEKSKVIFFIGPTGVGKTTTIAKIASHFVLNEHKRVVLITADTYRIAAVEQLRTYANILCVPLKVIYSADEINEAIEEHADKDLIFIDTAGRSHKNEEQQEDIKALLDSVENKEVYLVLSATTKYKDLVKITEKYSLTTQYSLIFTKLDETICYGNILNVKKYTGANLSYATFGQNVPDDIGELDPQLVAKHILGGNE